MVEWDETLLLQGMTNSRLDIGKDCLEFLKVFFDSKSLYI